MAWSIPKTNWNLYSKFNIEDFNRIKNNIAYLHEISVATLGGFDIEDMGSDMDNYASYWNVDHFNAIEHNLLSIANKVSTKDYAFIVTVSATLDSNNSKQEITCKLNDVIIGQDGNNDKISSVFMGLCSSGDTIAVSGYKNSGSWTKFQSRVLCFPVAVRG